MSNKDVGSTNSSSDSHQKSNNSDDTRDQVNGTFVINKQKPTTKTNSSASYDSPRRSLCCLPCLGGYGREETDLSALSSTKLEVIRLLMVGKGDVGKSTVIKQIKNLCNDYPHKYKMFDETWSNRLPTFTQAQRASEKIQVLRNILHCMGTLLEKVEEYGYLFTSQQNKRVAERLLEQIGDVDTVLRRPKVELTSEMASDIAVLWKDSAVQQAWARRREYLIPDHATEYFLASKKLEQIAKPEYVPSADDILRARNPTRGTCDYNFEIDGTKFSFRDMGGQPTEIARFPAVVADWLNECGENSRKYILFVASLADYNQRLLGPNQKMTRLTESVRLMQILMNIENLRNTGFILFLNKRDLLQEKLRKFNDFNEHFPDSRQQQLQSQLNRPIPKPRRPQHSPRPEDAERIIGTSFHTGAQETLRRDRPLYMHFTCATDKAQMDGIIGAVRVDILFRYMQSGIPFP